MRRVFIRYELWEDYIHGMWRKISREEEAVFLERCIQFTGDHVLYGNAMMRVVREWKNTCINNLTNPSINYRAFIGHCACCLEFGCPEYITRMAWRKLTENQRSGADAAAEKAFKFWLYSYKKNYDPNQLFLQF